jgi:hypothetical protein
VLEGVFKSRECWKAFFKFRVSVDGSFIAFHRILSHLSHFQCIFSHFFIDFMRIYHIFIDVASMLHRFFSAPPLSAHLAIFSDRALFNRR